MLSFLGKKSENTPSIIRKKVSEMEKQNDHINAELKARYLESAQANLPRIYSEDIRVVTDKKALVNGDSFVVDLGNHYVGYFSFVLGYIDSYPDAPVRLSLKFCESKEELDADFSSYKGMLCPSWLQEEIINIDYIGEYKMPRRYAARYIKISVIYTPKKITLTDFLFTAVTSADKSALKEVNIDDAELKVIDRVACNTLKNCMHRIFEDGPKRDRRLWIGDMRLEALTNYYTYNQTDIVRRCLYLFAASDCDSDGILPAFVYENPIFVSGNWHPRDYALLFVVSLCDYYEHTKDKDTFFDLYPIARIQMESIYQKVDENGIIIERSVFLDWNDRLKKTTAFNGVYLYTLERLGAVLSELGHCDAAMYNERYARLKAAAFEKLYNKDENNFANAYDNYQVSVHSAAWMILGGVISEGVAWDVLQKSMKSKDALQAVTPYMNHYLVEAMMKLGREKEAFDHIRSFWGQMVKEGADTFYEVFVPGEPDVSPYGNKMINSMCHAWSCTPSYFIRKYALGN